MNMAMIENTYTIENTYSEWARLAWRPAPFFVGNVFKMNEKMLKVLNIV
jgi:hypothetical protein